MDIAAMSMGLKSAQLAQDVSLAMVKKTMEVQESTAVNLMKMIDSVAPSNNIIDVRA